MERQASLSPVPAGLSDVLDAAVRYAGEQLAVLVERNVVLRSTVIARVRLENMPAIQAGADRIVTAVYLSFEGDAGGHVVLLFEPQEAARVAAMLLGEEIDEAGELDPLASSALGEIGNVTTAAFLNSVAGSCGLAVYPSPPTVARDMAGALLDAIVGDLSLDAPDALLVHTILTVDGDLIHCELLLLPHASSYERLVESVGAAV